MVAPPRLQMLNKDQVKLVAEKFEVEVLEEDDIRIQAQPLYLHILPAWPPAPPHAAPRHRAQGPSALCCSLLPLCARSSVAWRLLHEVAHNRRPSTKLCT